MDSKSSRPASSKLKRRFRVLVAERNPTNQKVMILLLNHLGCEACCVPNGAEAARALSRAAYDVVFVEFPMPGSDGFSAVLETRKRSGPKNRIPLMAMMKTNSTEGHEQRIESGVDDYLLKPVDINQLASILAKWTGLNASAPAALKLTRGLEDTGLLKKVAQLFLKEAPGPLQSLQEAVRKMDLRALQESARALREICSPLGLQAMEVCCAKLEGLPHFSWEAESLMAGLARQFKNIEELLKIKNRKEAA